MGITLGFKESLDMMGLISIIHQHDQPQRAFNHLFIHIKKKTMPISKINLN